MNNRLTQRLYAAWQASVDDGKLINRFQSVADDPDGRWLTSDTIAFGVRSEQGKNVYYAQNLTQSRSIPGAVEEKTISELGFVCQYNGYRALRPGGQPKPLGRQADISPKPEDCHFSCQNASDPLSLLVRKPLLQVPLKHHVWNAYYNAAPIDPNGHFLWVPTDNSALTHYPQQLTRPFLEDAIALFSQLSNTLLFFNSLHSGASVNHIHFQAIAHHQHLAAEVCPLTPKNPNYAQLADYPARVMAFSPNSPVANIYKYIKQLQQRAVPFNLMIAGSRILLIPRNIDHEIVSEFPGNGIAALGMCGKIITVDYQAYKRANATRIKSAFEKMTLSAKDESN